MLHAMCWTFSWSGYYLLYSWYSDWSAGWSIWGLIPGCRQDSFLFSKIPPPAQWVPSFFPMHETGHSPPSSAKVKNKCSCTSAPPVCVCGMVLGVLWNLSVHHSVYNSTVLNCTQSQQQPVQICIHCLSKT